MFKMKIRSQSEHWILSTKLEKNLESKFSPQSQSAEITIALNLLLTEYFVSYIELTKKFTMQLT